MSRISFSPFHVRICPCLQVGNLPQASNGPEPFNGPFVFKQVKLDRGSKEITGEKDVAFCLDPERWQGSLRPLTSLGFSVLQPLYSLCESCLRLDRCIMSINCRCILHNYTASFLLLGHALGVCNGPCEECVLRSFLEAGRS